MNGSPFESVKMACLQLSDTIFGQSEEDNSFKRVHLVFYNNVLNPTIHTSKGTFDQEVNNQYVQGGTDFNICYNYIDKYVK